MIRKCFKCLKRLKFSFHLQDPGSNPTKGRNDKKLLPPDIDPIVSTKLDGGHCQTAVK